MSRPTQRILLSIGDPNGIGPEIAVKAVAALQDDPELNPVIVGDRFVVEHYVRGTGLRIEENDGTASAEAGVIHLLPVQNLPPDAFKPGQLSADAGRATVAYLVGPEIFISTFRGCFTPSEAPVVLSCGGG